MANDVAELVKEIRRGVDFLNKVQGLRKAGEVTLIHTVAYQLGYTSDKEKMSKEEGKALYDKAKDIIAAVRKKDRAAPFADYVADSLALIDVPGKQERKAERELEKLAAGLPVAAWRALPEQRGFGLLSLARIVGEAGDLSRFASPGKLWKFMAMHPHEKDGEVLMGSTWRGRANSDDPGLAKLRAVDWSEYKYNPPHRAVMAVIGGTLLKTNKGPYRARYREVRLRCFEARPKWGPWGPCSEKCGGADPDCKCVGTGYQSLHSHKQATFLAEKLLLKNLWVEWRRLAGDLPPMPDWDLSRGDTMSETEVGLAAV